MKTFFEADQRTGKHKEKPGVMTIYGREASSNENLTIGSAPVNWADYVELKTHRV